MRDRACISSLGETFADVIQKIWPFNVADDRGRASPLNGGVFGAFANFIMCVCLSISLSVRLNKTTRLPLKGIWWNLMFEIFRKPVDKIQVSVKSDKINEYFTLIRFYIYDNISHNSS